MSFYRRWRVPGGRFFFTIVTHERRPILTPDMARPLLHQAIADAQARKPFDIVAMVLMPDHLHMLIRLPPTIDDYSSRLAKLKRNFTELFLNAGGDEGSSTASRTRQRNRGVWEKRFHEHWIRDDRDFRRHVDYIHFNPVKHGYSKRPHEWAWSTFHSYLAKGEYAFDWCEDVPMPADRKIECL